MAPRLGGVISTEVSKSESLIRVKIVGRPEPAAIVSMLDELNTLVRQDPSLGILIDETELRPSFVGPGDIGRFAQAWQRGTALPGSRIAVFVSNPAMYGLNRMFQGLIGHAGEGRMSVFTDRGRAIAWLQVSETAAGVSSDPSGQVTGRR
jgi:hypothetical protein